MARLVTQFQISCQQRERGMKEGNMNRKSSLIIFFHMGTFFRQAFSKCSQLITCTVLFRPARVQMIKQSHNRADNFFKSVK